MEETLFYVIGITLVVAALTVSALGLRWEAFPPARVVLVGVIAVFFMLVGGTTTFAVLSAREEQKHREAEEAEAAEEEKAAEEGAAEEATTLELSSPASGEILFDQTKLEAPAGAVEIDFTNESDAVPHNVFIEQDDTVIAESETVTGASTSVSEELESGEYVFFCAVPGHREAGMEGTLTVK